MLCPICKQPVNLEKAIFDEKGRVVHEECHVNQLLAQPPDAPHPAATQNKIERQP